MLKIIAHAQQLKHTYYVKTKIKIAILAVLLVIIPASCLLTKDGSYADVNTEWLYVYKTDTCTVWVDRIDAIEGVIVRDTKGRMSNTIYGRVNPKHLHKKSKR